jgi:hypothetical protein
LLAKYVGLAHGVVGLVVLANGALGQAIVGAAVECVVLIAQHVSHFQHDVIYRKRAPVDHQFLRDTSAALLQEDVVCVHVADDNFVGERRKGAK